MAESLMPGERSIALVRQHWSVVAGHVVAAAVIVVAAVVVSVVLPAKVGSAAIGGIKSIALLVIIVATIAWAGLRMMRWRFATYHLTDRRIIMEGGILSRTAETIPLDRIQNTVIHRPLGDRMIGAGDIEIESAGRDGVEVLHRIPQAQTFYNDLLTAMNTTPGAAGGRPTGI